MADRPLVPTYNPDDPDDDPRYKIVQCSRCDRLYQCLPLDDFIDPAPALGWTKGRVCERCLLALARLKEMHLG